MAFGSGARSLRSGARGAPLSDRGARKPSGRPRAGSRREKRLRDLAAAEMELRRREQQRPKTLDAEQLKHIQMLGSDIRRVWTAAATTDRDRKELLRTLLEEIGRAS